MGFLTSPKDRDLLVNHPDQAARAIANGILKFLTDQG
jgi:N-acetylmuramoyl-L-alanine amidase